METLAPNSLAKAQCTARTSANRWACVAFVIAAAILAVPGAARAQTAAAPACANDSTFHYLDFWVGDWSVIDDATGKEDGTDLVERILDGCAVMESWHGNDGSAGKSLFYFVPSERRWKQVWVTQQALALGGMKEKRLVWRGADGSTRFQGELVGERGRVLLDRTTLTPLAGGRVHQVIEHSLDGGTTWVESFRATYVSRAKQ